MPISPAILAEYAALTTDVGLADLSGRALVEVTGADRVQLLHAFTTADVKKLAAGRGGESFVTSPQGKTLGHVLLLQRGESLLLISTPAQAGKLIAHFDRYIISEDVTLADATERLGVLLVAGPRAAQVLTALSSSQPPAELLDHAAIVVAGCKVLAVRVEHVRPLSYYLVLDRGDQPAVAEAIQAAGATPCSLEASEICRVEAGVPAYGQDIDDDNLPQELVRDARAISFTKGCYLGQETIARIDAVGHVNRHLAGVRLHGDQVPPPGTPLLLDGKQVGHLTSSVWSPRWQSPLALALIRRVHSKVGTKLVSPGGDVEVITLPAP